MLGSYRGRNAEPLALRCLSYRGDGHLQVGKREGLSGPCSYSGVGGSGPAPSWGPSPLHHAAVSCH